MSVYRVVFSGAVRDQLDRIADYLSVHTDQEPADKIVGAVIDRCLELDTFPDRGTSREELGQGVRTIPFRRIATIDYVVAGADVVIIGISWKGQRIEDAIG